MKHTDFLIVGTGAAGLFCALQIPSDKQVLMITKEDADESDSFLAQGGICVLKSDDDYDSYFEDTMRAGHYENRKESVDIMIRSSQSIIKQLVEYGVDFKMANSATPEKVVTPIHVFYSTKILPGKKSQAHFWRGRENAKTLPF